MTEPTTGAPLDLDAIRADQVTATTSPVRPGITAAEVDAWNEAVERCAEVHVPALLAALAERDATIARYDTALIEATRRAEEDEDGEPTRAALIETIAATDAERDRLEAEVEQLRAKSAVEARRTGDPEALVDDEDARLRDTLMKITVMADQDRRRLRAEIERLRAEQLPESEPCVDTTEDYRVVVREVGGGWRALSAEQPTLTAATERMAEVRAGEPWRARLRVWRRRIEWTSAAIEDCDASRAPESPADAPTLSEGPTPAPDRP